VRPRWDIDERGRGVGDARRLLPEARSLLDVVTGVVSAEGRYATHGHMLRLRVTP
jgi:hypothetical protein